MRNLLALACISLTLAATSTAANAQQQLYLLDFEADLPGPGTPTGMYQFHGDGGLAVWSEQILDVGGDQAYRQSADAAPTAPYWYSGGGGPGAVTPAAGGVIVEGPEGNDPGNYRFSAEVLFTGETVAAPVGFAIDQFDSDYEAVNGIDTNNDGDMLDGATTFKIEVRPLLSASPEFQTVSFFLDAAAPTGGTGVLPQHIGFDSANNLSWAFFFGGAEFGIDTGNVVTLDNVKFEFVPPSAFPGDFDGDQDADGEDFLIWQRGESPDPRSAGDFADWRSGFGEPAPGVASIPEPATIVLATGLGLAMAMAFRRSR